MPKYKYSGLNKSGKLVKGSLTAITKSQARSHLKSNSIKVTALQEIKENKFFQLTEEKKVPMQEVILFNRLLSGALRNGMSIKESMEVLYRQIHHPKLRKIVFTISADIKSGMDFSASVKNFPDVFPVYYSPMIKAGEEIGDLPQVLDQIGDYAEKSQDIKKNIMGIITYPAIVLSFGIGLVIIVMVFIMPKFKKTFADLGGALPGPTIALNMVSDFFTQYYLLLLIMIVGVLLWLFFYNKTAEGKKKVSKWMLNVPLVGSIIKSLAIVSFLKTTSTLINNGVPILQTLSIVEDTITNLVVRNVVTDMKKNVVKGMNLSDPLKQNEDIFPPMVANAVSMGEKTGELGSVLVKTADFYDKQILYDLKSIAAKINPIITLVIGGFVLWVALAIYLPMFDMMTQVG